MTKVTLEWGGKTYTIGPHEAFEAGEIIEDIVTLSDLPALAAKPKFHVLARVYGSLLRFCGAKATDAEVHTAMMAQVKTGGGGEMMAASVLSAVVELLMDGAPTDGGGDDGKKDSAS